MLMEVMQENEMMDTNEVDWYIGGTDMDTGSFIWPKVIIYSSKNNLFKILENKHCEILVSCSDK